VRAANWKKEDDVNEAKAKKLKEKDEEDENYWIKRLAELKQKQDDLELECEELRERILVLKEVDME
jgi:hypothetical protein